MNLVGFAMRRPITLLVMVIAMAGAGVLALRQMPRDVFPDLGVPVIYVAQPYGGMDPAQMEGFLTNYYEYHFLYINGIEHVESKSIQGVALIKLQFHPGTNMAQAMAETVSYVNRSRAFMPPGTVPPFVMRFDAGSVPVGTLVFSSQTRSLAEMQDAALFRVRPLFATLPGVSAPPPFGGTPRSIVIRADPDRLRSYNMSPDEVVSALAAGNSVSPSGNVRIGDKMPMVPINSVVAEAKDMGAIPIRYDGTRTIFIRDVATIEDGSDIATGVALVNGRRTVYIPVTKRADASTLAVVDLVKTNLGKFQAALPDDVKVSYEFDQSPYVTRAISGLAIEGALGAGLTGLMVLLFLRDWRSAIVVVVNIPLSLLAAALAMWIGGQTVNIMTLGGMALAVGILVDEATVTIENIHTHLGRGASLARAALDATRETTGPRFLAMLCVLAVFIPAFFMTGAARNLFVPLSLAVGFSMVASYILSSTLVPVLAVWFLRHKHSRMDRAGGAGSAHENGDGAAQTGKHAQEEFSGMRAGYAATISGIVRLRWVLAPVYLLAAAAAVYIMGRPLGIEIFPVVDAGQFSLRLRAPAGTRMEQTEKIALEALETVKREVGAGNVEISLGFVGVQPGAYPVNTIHLWTGGPEEAVMQVQLKRGTKIVVADLKEKLREKLATALPGVRFSFEPSDIVSRVMSFGARTPVEIAVSGPNMPNNQAFAGKVQAELAKVPSLRDLQYEQALDYPTLKVDVDRERAGVLGISAAEVARSMVAATWSSRYVTANYWADPKSGVAYQVQVEIPQKQMASAEDLRNLPIARREGEQVPLRNLASVTPGTAIGQYDRYNMQRSVTLSANIAGEDLGRTVGRVERAVAAAGKPPEKVTVNIRGQATPLAEMLGGLGTGLIVAVIVIFLLLAANFQSFKLALAVVLTTPAVIAGVAISLTITRTTLNIQSFMGAIMALGVAVANSILLVTFAERRRMDGASARQAAIEGAASRLRPILMTSLAMMAGMVPMSIGLGDGGEQTAPLGRAVIGGLAGASLATLFILPAIFAIIQGDKRRSASLDPEDEQSRHFEMPVTAQAVIAAPGVIAAKAGREAPVVAPG